MLYYTKSKPKQVCLKTLDSIISFGCKFLDLEIEELYVEFANLGDTAAYVDSDKEEQVAEMTINKYLHKVEGELETTIFHELVHVKQVMDGRLNTCSPARWLGKTYQDCSYRDLPWEQEAYALEEKMYDKWQIEVGMM